MSAANGNGGLNRTLLTLSISGGVVALAGPVFILIAGLNDKTNKLDELLQREMRLVSGVVEEKVNALRSEFERQIAAARELREEQVGELKRRIASVEVPTTVVRDEQLSELRRRIELLERDEGKD